MANTFKLKTKANVGVTTTAVYVAPGSTTTVVIGITASNISGVQKGLIAQEAEAVSPAFVTTPSTGVKALVPDEIFWHMLNSIKELSTKVDKLEQENIALRVRVTNLEDN